MTSIKVAGKLLTAAVDERKLTYLLLPFGEEGRTNRGVVTAAKGVITVPGERLKANIEHDRTRPVAWLEASEEEDGIHAVVEVARTSAGDDLLAEAAAGLRTGISVEIDDTVIRDGAIVAGVLSGAGFVTDPAFPSARLAAADVGDLPPDFPVYSLPSESSTESTEEIVVDGVTYVVVRKSTSTTTVEPKDQPEAAPETPDDAPPSDDAAPAAGSETDVTAPVNAGAAPAAAPDGLHAAKTTPAAPATPSKPKTLEEAAARLAAAFQSGGDTALTAALVDITDANVPGSAIASPDWLGQVWEDAPYERLYIPLIRSGVLTSWKANGWRFATKPFVAKYTGNKTDVPSSGMTAEPVNYGIQRWANAADIDRRYVDFSDQELIAAFIRANVESYKEVTDLDTLDQILLAADAVTPGAVPTGISPAVAAVADGALALLADHLRPSAAIVGADLFRDLLLTPKDKISEFLSESFGLQGGETAGFRIVPSAEADMTGQVVVLDGRTVELREYGSGTPVNVQAENVAKGGVDVAVFGYTSFRVLRDGGVRQLDLSV